MGRKLIIFGNGLGMALDPNHFSLNAALADIWDLPDFLTPAQRQLIELCLQRSGAPKGEDELDTLHQAVTHCKALAEIGSGDVHWLTQDGVNFPEITSTYIHKVATKLHNYSGGLPKGFETDLISFIKNTKSHVATLNYDKLLYTSFIENDIFNGYSGYLADGMVNQGFSAEALERRYNNDFGYYLHLHGSPLFIDSDEYTYKLPRQQLTLDINVPSKHIVLTHIRRKPSVISASLVLSSYWNYLQLALSESEEVILFGYSGFDTHLNNLLRPYLRAIPLRVVEWDGASDQYASENYWNNIFGREVEVEVVRLSNITDFKDW